VSSQGAEKLTELLHDVGTANQADSWICASGVSTTKLIMRSTALVLLMMPLVASAALMRVDFTVEGDASDTNPDRAFGSGYFVFDVPPGPGFFYEVPTTEGEFTWNGDTVRLYHVDVYYFADGTLGNLGVRRSFSGGYSEIALQVHDPYYASLGWFYYLLCSDTDYACVSCLGPVTSFTMTAIGVPEPTGLALLGLGVFGTVVARRWKATT
jgi:hypothetical protein